MSGRMTRQGYQRLIEEDIAWLNRQEPERPESPANERTHIRMILQRAVEYEYGPEHIPTEADSCAACRGTGVADASLRNCSHCYGRGYLTPSSGEPFVIWNRHSYVWWRPDRAGYSPSLMRAGLYSEAEAREIERLRGSDIAMPLRYAIRLDAEAKPVPSIEGTAASWLLRRGFHTDETKEARAAPD